MNLNLDGHVLERIEFGFVLQLSFSGGYGIQAENPILLTTPAGSTTIQPGVDSSTELAALIGERVVALVAEEAGALDLSLTGGSRLRVEPDDRFEAWTFFGPEQRKIVSLPGGGLSVWPPLRTSRAPSNHEP